MDRLKGLEVPRVRPRLPLLPVSRLRVLLRSPRGRLRLRGDPRARQPRAHRGRAAQSIWRYADLLPLDLPDGEPPIGAAVGFTPLVRARNLAARAGACKELYVKNDAVCHPTCSFKDRVVAVAIGKAREFGFDTVACASTGNLANSVAAHAAEARLKSYIFIPADLEQGKVIATLDLRPDARGGARGPTTRSTGSAPRSATSTTGPS